MKQSSNYTESLSALDENDILNPSEDVIAVQLKFRACLKILTVELRTLSTGYEIDGGKLRYQLYHWLKKVIAFRELVTIVPILRRATVGIWQKWRCN